MKVDLSRFMVLVGASGDNDNEWGGDYWQHDVVHLLTKIQKIFGRQSRRSDSCDTAKKGIFVLHFFLREYQAYMR